ncbi:IclR family transcriptional regulator [Alteribacillus bidgolensis]|uniref:Transcriptional regulator, IclR family n=1 Tax=Alteribacillus bidgolensis TaxID=930129 RepID=A0A1G8I5N3_9BACI|nr:IclR family transcriptional regulator [Alteribacillus bidgolensis]SDI14061.1 transcriptional regulator, IclR family [Alteribacillus bidgolensis]
MDSSIEETTTESKQSKTVGVLEKAILVIEALEDTKDGIGLTEVARRTGVNKTSCYRILHTLMGDNMVEYGERQGTYRLGVRMLELGGAVQRRINLRQLALPVITDLTQKIEETSFLCLLNKDRAVCIERIEGEHVQVLAMRVGDSWPLYQGAAPRAILANLEDKKIESILSEKSIEPITSKTPTDPNMYWNMVEDIRETGYSISREDVTLGVAALGAPVFDHNGNIVAAVSVSSTVHRISKESEKDISEHVIGAANEVSRRMGWTGNNK